MEEYKLIHPVQFGSEKIESIKIGRPKGKHIKKLPAAPVMWDFIEIASRVSGVSINVFEDMDSEDILAIAGVVGKCVVGSQAIGQ